MRAAASPTAAAVARSHKKKTQMNSQNPIKNPPCPNKKSAIANISIFVAVLFACGFLLFPCLKFFSYGFSDFWKTTVAAVDEELGIANGFYLVSGFGFMIACSVLLWVFSCCAGKKCDNPNCRGLRNAPEFDIKIETEDCLKNLHNSAGGDGGDKGFFELGEDYNRELGAELKKMAPLNGRAVLIFRAKCGCSAGRMVVWGQKKTRKARMKNLLAEDNQRQDISVNAKQRLEWTHQLHERFVEVVTQLGGADKAKPKSVMRLMGVRGLTLYHLKRQLQKYKLIKNGISSTANDSKKRVENYMVAESWIGDDKSRHQTNKAMLQIQLDIQRKLEAQIEVQKHLQLRIEAQGKYLQSVLSKAHEIIAGYCSSYIPVETARADLSELASAVNIGCLSSTFSHGGLIHEKTQNADCLLDSCSTSDKFNLHPHKMRGETEEIDLNGY